MSRRLWVGAGLVVYTAAAWGAYRYANQSKASSAEEGVACGGVWEGLAARYDASVERDERVTGITRRRASLLSRARGHVLEVACGTGRNLLMYPMESVTRVVATDASPAMLDQARSKLMEHGTTSLPPSPPWIVWRLSGRGADGSEEQKRRITFERVDAHDLSVFPDESFDTVVDTFGLCSFADPVAVLKEMQRVCKKDGQARILLLEHGRPERHWWLAKYLDKSAPRHEERWGCRWNKDISKLVEEAGLRVHDKTTYHLGTGYVIVAFPPKQ